VFKTKFNRLTLGDIPLSYTMKEFKEYLEHHKKETSGDKLMPSTIETYIYLLNSVGVNDKINLSKASEIIENTNNPMIYSTIRQFLKFCGYEDNQINRLNFKREILRSALKSKKFLQSKVLTRKEVKDLILSSEKLQDKLIFSLLYDTACRVSELINIRVKDINFKERSIEVLGKGGKKRSVFFNASTEELLTKHIQNKKKEDKLIIIRDNSGKPYQNQQHAIWRLCKRKGKKILHRNLHPHMFRHTRLTHMADEGADILDIAAYAGHEDIKTSQIYVEISSYRRKRAFKKYCSDIME